MAYCPQLSEAHKEFEDLLTQLEEKLVLIDDGTPETIPELLQEAWQLRALIAEKRLALEKFFAEAKLYAEPKFSEEGKKKLYAEQDAFINELFNFDSKIAQQMISATTDGRMIYPDDEDEQGTRDLEAYYRAIMNSLGTRTDRDAQHTRHRLITEFGYEANLTDLRSYYGAESPMFMSYQHIELSKGYMGLINVIHSLKNVDTEEGWQIRDRLLHEGKERLNTKEHILESLTGANSLRAKEFRSSVLKDLLAHPPTKKEPYLSEPNKLLQSLAGIDDEGAWKIRDAIQSETTQDSMLLSVSGCHSLRAWEIRDEYLEHAETVHDYIWIGGTLAGLDSLRAREMREIIFDEIEESIVNGEFFEFWEGKRIGPMLANTNSTTSQKIRAFLKESHQYGAYLMSFC